MFSSIATDLLDPSLGITDTNDVSDVFVFDRDADEDGVYDEPGPLATSTIPISTRADGMAMTNSIFATAGSNAVSISGDGRYVVFSSSGSDMIEGGAAGMSVYLHDLWAKTTFLVGDSGTPIPLQISVTESVVATKPLRVVFSSGVDLDPAVTDINAKLDIFNFDAPIDIRMRAAIGDGYDLLEIQYEVQNAAATEPFEIGIYRSADGLFGDGDALLDTILIEGTDLDLGGHSLVREIGTEFADQIILPGIGESAVEDNMDYQILFVADHLNQIEEFDGSAFNDDNTARFENAYHLRGGPVFIHGRTGLVAGNDILTVTEIDEALTEVRLNLSTYGYEPGDVTSIRFRGHEGNDTVQAASTPDLLIGGSGGDVLRGGPGDDWIDGGIDGDKLFGEEGVDTILDGMGDDFIDPGPDGGVIVATPGSDDLFFGLANDGFLDFSFADHAITIDFDAVDIKQTVDIDDNTVTLQGGNLLFDFAGSGFDDEFFVKVKDGDRTLSGGAGNDRINIDANGRNVIFDGTTLIPEIGGTLTLLDFEDINIFNFPPIVVDNDDASYADTGFFDSDANFQQGVNGGVRFSGAGDGHTATWAFPELPPGRAMIAATWTNAPDRASNATYTIKNGDQTIAEIPINQKVAPDDLQADGFGWENLVFVDLGLAVTDITVELSDDTADGFVAADAVRIYPVGDLVIPIDNRSPAFSAVEGTVVDGVGQFGSEVVFPRGSGSTVAVWDFSGINVAGFASGLYEVLATWTGSAGGATDATFNIDNGISQQITRVNQLLDSGFGTSSAFASLGVVNLDDINNLTISLANNPNGDVIADSIQIRTAPLATVTYFNLDTGRQAPTASGGGIDLGSIPISVAKASEYIGTTLTIHNTGSGSLDLQKAVTVGDFLVNSPNDVAGSIPPGGSREMTVFTFKNEIGTYDGTITIPSNDPVNPSYVINISGTVAPDPTPDGSFEVDVHQFADHQLQIEAKFLPVVDNFFERVGLDFEFDVKLDAIGDGNFSSVDFTETRLNDTTTILTPDPVAFQLASALNDPQFQLILRALNGSGASSAPQEVHLDFGRQPPAAVEAPLKLENSLEPFSEAFWPITVDFGDHVELLEVTWHLNAELVHTSKNAPFIALIPQLVQGQPSTLEARATDVYGKTHTASLNISPPTTTTGTLSGQEWHDLNSDGFKDANEPGLNGWTIEVVNDMGQVIATATTMDVDLDGDNLIDPATERGRYSVDVAAGSWTVRPVPRSGWRQTSPSLDRVAENAFNLDRDLDLHATQSDFENWGGRDEKWFYSGRNRQWLFVIPDGTVFEWDGSGRDNLTGTNVGQLDSRFYADLSKIYSATNPSIVPVDVVSGQTTKDVSFGHVAFGAIEGRKWHDLNADGVRDAIEPWLNGWAIHLQDDDGNVVATTITADRDLNNDQQIDPETEAGWYVFEQLGSGSFAVGEEERTGWTQTFPNRPVAQTAFDLDQSLNLRATRSDFRNWGGLNERWFMSDQGWHYIIPSGAVFKWDNSPQTALTGIQVASLTAEYWDNFARLHNAVMPGRYRVPVNDGTVSHINFGNVLN